MTDISKYPLDRLISLAFVYGLLSDYRMTPSEIELISDIDALTFDPEQARLYLQGLITGYEIRANEFSRAYRLG